MGRFGGSGGGYGRRNNEEREEKSERKSSGSSRGSYGNSRSGGAGRSYSGGGKKRGGGFVNLGSLTTKKGTPDRVVDELRSDKIGLWWQVYLPEGTKSITLKKGDRVFIQLGQFHEKAPDFVVGSVSLPTEEDSRDSRDDRDED